MKAKNYLKQLSPEDEIFSVEEKPEYSETQMLMFAESYQNSEIVRTNNTKYSKRYVAEQRFFSLGNGVMFEKGSRFEFTKYLIPYIVTGHLKPIL